MSPTPTTTDEHPADVDAADAIDHAAAPAEGATSTLLLEELLIEEISIDGMCGVY